MTGNFLIDLTIFLVIIAVACLFASHIVNRTRKKTGYEETLKKVMETPDIIIHGAQDLGGVFTARVRYTLDESDSKLPVIATFDLETGPPARTVKEGVTVRLPMYTKGAMHYWLQLDTSGTEITRVGLSTERHHSGGVVLWEE